jgi:hypothetical protein
MSRLGRYHGGRVRKARGSSRNHERLSPPNTHAIRTSGNMISRFKIRTNHARTYHLFPKLAFLLAAPDMRGFRPTFTPLCCARNMLKTLESRRTHPFDFIH